MNIGFTGTSSHPLKRDQREYLRVELLLRAAPMGETTYLHLGDCIHADKECHEIAVAQMDMLNRRMFVTVGHIPDNDSKRAFCHYEIQLPPKPYILRNHDIVDACSVLLACPGLDVEEVSYSGTWATIRYALKKGKQVVIIWPSGKVEDGWEFYKRDGKLNSVRREYLKATAQGERLF